MLTSHIDSLLPRRDWNRRDFVGGAVGSGFAAAALPIAARTVVRTDDAGLVAGPVTVPVAGFAMPAYRAAPAGKAHAPVILVVSEIFGVHEHIADVTRRFAKAGYFAVAPELFVRHGDAKAPSDIPTLWTTIVTKASDTQVCGDLDATVAWAGTQGADTTRLGVTGFCWGGRIAWVYAAHNPQVDAGVAWYGGFGKAPHAGDASVVELAPRIKAPVLGLYGGADDGIPVASVEQMRLALKAAGNTASEIVVYPDTPHAFHADYRNTFRAGPAADGWKRTLAFFKAHGVA